MIATLLTSILTGPIRAYKFFLSPWIGQTCRFTPTCSYYAIQAIETLVPTRGLYLSAKRIGRCNPWCQGGHDPVPESDALKKKNSDLSTRCHTD